MMAGDDADVALSGMKGGVCMSEDGLTDLSRLKLSLFDPILLMKGTPPNGTAHLR